MVHLEILGAVVALITVVVAVYQTDIGTACLSGLEPTEVDALTLLRLVVVEAQNVHPVRCVDGQSANRAVDVDTLTVAHAPIVGARCGNGELSFNVATINVAVTAQVLLAGAR